MMRLSFSLCLIFGMAVVSKGQQCTVDCSGQSAGSLVPDPYDCHKYYGCLADGSPTDSPLSCDDGYYFSTSYNSCQPEYSTCEPECIRPSCSLSCNTAVTFIANPRNCSQFYLCSPSGQPVLSECTPERPFFNGQECTEDEFFCCDPCTSECNEAGVEIIDPEDCSKYYFCDSNLNSTSAECNEGEYFDPLQGHCVPSGGQQCQDLCYLGSLITPETSTTDYTTNNNGYFKTATSTPDYTTNYYGYY